MIPLSQSHLSHLDTCARKYQYVFFDALSGPSTYEQHVTTQWGSQFHLLMQQQALDLPVGVLSPADEEMARSLSALKLAAPEIFAYLPESQVTRSQIPDAEENQDSTSGSEGSNQDASTFSQSEQRRTLEFNGYLLTVIYDLVVMSPSGPVNQTDNQPARGQIFDWKTHQRPPRKEWLQNDWQTRLYSYVLCETSELTPEQISMTYWFVRTGKTSDETGKSSDEARPSSEPSSPQKPSFYRFDYSLTQHDKTRKDLQRLTDNLTKMRARTDFPKVAIEEGACNHCAFNVRCDRHTDGRHHPQGLKPNQLQTNSTDPVQILKAARQLTADTVEEIPL